MKRILLISDVHYCQDEYGGISRDEKAQRLIDQINAENEKYPIEMILFLGDYSLDHWAWNSKGTWLVHERSYTKELIDKYLSKLDIPFCLIPGNHEQYGEENWKMISGQSRTAEIELDDCLFILWDSFGDELDPDYHSDGKYTAPDAKKIKEIMDAHGSKKVFLCSHHFAPLETEEEAELIRDERVVCLFRGHTHSSKILTLSEKYGSKLLVQTGSWAGINNESDERWGVRELCIYEDKVTSAYIVDRHDLAHEGKSYTFEAEIRDTVEIKL